MQCLLQLVGRGKKNPNDQKNSHPKRDRPSLSQRGFRTPANEVHSDSDSSVHYSRQNGKETEGKKGKGRERSDSHQIKRDEEPQQRLELV